MYLASASPRRRAILNLCRIDFDVAEHVLTEPLPRGPEWRRWVRRWAGRKAQDAAGRLRQGLVIGADTIVVQGKRGLGKPRGAPEARAMLQRLSAGTHEVITGVAVVDLRNGRTASGSESTRIRFRKLTQREITAYVRSGEPLDKAGAYAIQGGAGRFVRSIEGPLDNVIGLPIGCLVRILRRVLH